MGLGSGIYQTMSFVSTVSVGNFTPHPRRETVFGTVPLNRGQFRPGGSETWNLFATPGPDGSEIAVEFQEFGPRYEDGSWSHLLVQVPVAVVAGDRWNTSARGYQAGPPEIWDLKPYEWLKEEAITLEMRQESASFTWSQNSAVDLANTKIRLNIQARPHLSAISVPLRTLEFDLETGRLLDYTTGNPIASGRVELDATAGGDVKLSRTWVVTARLYPEWETPTGTTEEPATLIRIYYTVAHDTYGGRFVKFWGEVANSLVTRDQSDPDQTYPWRDDYLTHEFVVQPTVEIEVPDQADDCLISTESIFLESAPVRNGNVISFPLTEITPVSSGNEVGAEAFSAYCNFTFDGVIAYMSGTPTSADFDTYQAIQHLNDDVTHPTIGSDVVRQPSVRGWQDQMDLVSLNWTTRQEAWLAYEAIVEAWSEAGELVLRTMPETDRTAAAILTGRDMNSLLGRRSRWSFSPQPLYGLRNDTSQAGDAPEYGASTFDWIAGTGWPDRRALKTGAMVDAQRFFCRRYNDGTPLDHLNHRHKAAEMYTNVLLFNSKSIYPLHTKAYADGIGKRGIGGRAPTPERFPRRWSPPDNQHFTMTVTPSSVMLYPSPWARHGHIKDFEANAIATLLDASPEISVNKINDYNFVRRFAFVIPREQRATQAVAHAWSITGNPVAARRCATIVNVLGTFGFSSRTDNQQRFDRATPYYSDAALDNELAAPFLTPDVIFMDPLPGVKRDKTGVWWAEWLGIFARTTWGARKILIRSDASDPEFALGGLNATAEIQRAGDIIRAIGNSYAKYGFWKDAQATENKPVQATEIHYLWDPSQPGRGLSSSTPGHWSGNGTDTDRNTATGDAIIESITSAGRVSIQSHGTWNPSDLGSSVVGIFFDGMQGETTLNGTTQDATFNSDGRFDIINPPTLNGPNYVRNSGFARFAYRIPFARWKALRQGATFQYHAQTVGGLMAAAVLEQQQANPDAAAIAGYQDIFVDNPLWRAFGSNGLVGGGTGAEGWSAERWLSYVGVVPRPFTRWDFNPGDPPTRPQNTRLVERNTELEVRWDYDLSSEPPVDRFVLERAEDPLFTVSFVSINVTPQAGPTHSYVDSSVSVGTRYYYRVKAVRSSLESAYGETVAGELTGGLNTPPATPTDLTATGASGQIDLAWVDQATDEDTYYVERRVEGFGEFVQITTLPANSAAYADNDAALQLGVSYEYRVRCSRPTTPVLFSQYSNTDSAQLVGSNPPDPPSDFRVTATQTPTAELTWTDNSTNEDGFEIERMLAAGSWGPLVTKPADSTSHSDATVVREETYRYRIRATNATAGNSVWVISQTDVTIPPLVAPLVPTNPPDNFVAAISPVENILLTWEVATADDLGYDIERADNGGAFTTLVTVGSRETSYLDETTEFGNTYQYRARSNNSDTGTSDWANSNTILLSSNITLSNNRTGRTYRGTLPATQNTPAFWGADGNIDGVEIEFVQLAEDTGLLAADRGQLALEWFISGAWEPLLKASGSTGLASATNVIIQPRLQLRVSNPTAAAANYSLTVRFL